MKNMNNIKVIVISLKHEKQRRLFIQKQLQEIGLDVTFFDAINGSKENVFLNPDYNKLKRRLFYGKDLTDGELGCFLSHRAVIKKIVLERIEHCLVLEDDALLLQNFSSVLVSLLNCSYSWELIRFLGNPKIEKLTQRKILKLFGEYYLTRLATSPGGAYAYLISYDGAKKLAKALNEIYLPIDSVMGHPWRAGIEVLTVQPAVATWNKEFISAIGDARFEKNKLRGLIRLVYPITRFLYKMHEGFMKKIYFYIKLYADKNIKC